MKNTLLTKGSHKYLLKLININNISGKISKYCKVGLRSHEMAQITEYKPLEDGIFDWKSKKRPKPH